MGVVAFFTVGDSHNTSLDIPVNVDGYTHLPDYRGRVVEAYKKEGKWYVMIEWVKFKRDPPITSPPPESEMEYNGDSKDLTSVLVKCLHEGCETLVGFSRQKCQSHFDIRSFLACFSSLAQ